MMTLTTTRLKRSVHKNDVDIDDHEDVRNDATTIIDDITDN